ncbi:hypothetical protein [Methylovulum psychrotolerans]|uniref:Scaffolding protein n=1 Tax=Methylovulum psychrotolerans TaxID=1704499 RepID=A0A1Z4C0F7_9GAMM|nr:hypothetical protein [Methylovulum psychrotolerans]ASF47003.1 hypothetical protein CEK71_13495 [Methylovulum psychrotolerans]
MSTEDPANPSGGAVNPAAANPQNPAAPAPAAAIDPSAIEQAATAKARAEASAQFKEATGYDSPEAFKEAKLKSEGKLQELADTKTQELEVVKGQYHQTLISNAILSHAADAIDPSDVAALLSGQGKVDTNGVVTIGGKSPADAVKDLLASKPHWAKPQGQPGSGAPPHQPLADGEKTQQAYQDAAKRGDVLGMLKINNGVKQ